MADLVRGALLHRVMLDPLVVVELLIVRHFALQLDAHLLSLSVAVPQLVDLNSLDVDLLVQLLDGVVLVVYLLQQLLSVQLQLVDLGDTSVKACFVLVAFGGG